MRFIRLLAGFMLAAMSLHPFPVSASAFDDRPVIGVSGQNPPTQSVQAIMRMLRENGAYPVLLPHDLDAVSLFPEVRHILESQVALQQLLDHVRNGSGDPEVNLRLACHRLIRSAEALHQIRSHAVT